MMKRTLPPSTAWRREVFGNDALRLKRGELAIGAKGKRIILIEPGKAQAR
ncbi:hypothetical protein [Parvibaculum sp.]